MRTAGSNRLRGKLRAVNFAPGSSLIRLDFIEHKSERSVMPQDTGVGRNVVLDGLDFASLRRVWEQTFGADMKELDWRRMVFEKAAERIRKQSSDERDVVPHRR